MGKQHNNYPLIWVRGAGEMGSAVAVSLFQSGFPVIISEIYPPLAIRRSVSFSDCIINGQSEVSGVKAVLNKTDLLDLSILQLFNDDPEKILGLNPKILIDARMKKKYNKDYRTWISFVVGLGPGFEAGVNCHTIIETMRGHDLGRIIWSGEPQPNTGIPGTIQGESKKRVLYSPTKGTVIWQTRIGDLVNQNQIIGIINEDLEIRAPLNGLVRGLLHPLTPVYKGLKIADIDPRGDKVDHFRVSDKAHSIGRASLEAVMVYLNQ